MIGCQSTAENQLALRVAGRSVDYQVQVNGEAIMVPLLLILDELNLSYQINQNSIQFGDIEVTIDSQIALVAGNARNLDHAVKKKWRGDFNSAKFFNC